MGCMTTAKISRLREVVELRRRIEKLRAELTKLPVSRQARSYHVSAPPTSRRRSVLTLEQKRALAHLGELSRLNVGNKRLQWELGVSRMTIIRYMHQIRRER